MNKILATSIMLVSLGSSQLATAANTVNEGNSNNKDHVNVTQDAMHKTMAKTWLGVSLAPVPEAIFNQLGSVIPAKQGVLVRSVVPNSPASHAGLHNFDILLSFNNSNNEQQLYSAEQLAGLIASSKAGDEVTFGVVSNGFKKEVKVKLGEKEDVSPLARRPNPIFGGFNNGAINPQAIFPKMPSIPKSKGQVSVMQQFESISINSLPDDRFKAKVTYQENGGEKKEFIFEGKYDEIRKKIEGSKELPESKKNSLLNALKNNPDQLIPDNFMHFPQMPAFPVMPSFDHFFNQKQQQIPSWFNNGPKL